MRHITQVNIGFGSALGRANYKLPCEGSITLSDGTVIQACDIRQGRYLGAGEGVVLRLLPHEATLHKWVNEVRTRSCDPVFSHPDEDLGVICEGRLIGKGTEAWRGENLALNTTNELIKATGTLGSVIVRSDSPLDATPRVYTLFGLLRQLCWETGLNLMSYKRLRLYSPGRGYETMIRFDQSVEAKRFFTKMYFEVCR